MDDPETFPMRPGVWREPAPARDPVADRTPDQAGSAAADPHSEPTPGDTIWLSQARPTRADAVKNRALLLNTARSLFSLHGVETVTMSQVAEAAGVGKGTLYRHFPGKPQLCHALLDDDQRALQREVLARLGRVRSSAEARAALGWFVGAIMTFCARNHAILAGEESAFGEETLYHPAHLWWRQTLRALLVQAGTTLDPDYAADTLYILLDPRTLRFQNTRGLSDAARRAQLDRLIDLLIPTSM